MDEDEKKNCDKECDKVSKGSGERVFFIFRYIEIWDCGIIFGKIMGFNIFIF